MGLRSFTFEGLFILGIGTTSASFHAVGNIAVVSDMFRICSNFSGMAVKTSFHILVDIFVIPDDLYI